MPHTKNTFAGFFEGFPEAEYLNAVYGDHPIFMIAKKAKLEDSHLEQLEALQPQVNETLQDETLKLRNQNNQQIITINDGLTQRLLAAISSRYEIQIDIKQLYDFFTLGFDDNGASIINEQLESNPLYQKLRDDAKNSGSQAEAAGGRAKYALSNDGDQGVASQVDAVLSEKEKFVIDIVKFHPQFCESSTFTEVLLKKFDQENWPVSIIGMPQLIINKIKDEVCCQIFGVVEDVVEDADKNKSYEESLGAVRAHLGGIFAQITNDYKKQYYTNIIDQFEQQPFTIDDSLEHAAAIFLSLCTLADITALLSNSPGFLTQLESKTDGIKEGSAVDRLYTMLSLCSYIDKIQPENQDALKNQVSTVIQKQSPPLNEVNTLCQAIGTVMSSQKNNAEEASADSKLAQAGAQLITEVAKHPFPKAANDNERAGTKLTILRDTVKLVVDPTAKRIQHYKKLARKPSVGWVIGGAMLSLAGLAMAAGSLAFAAVTGASVVGGVVGAAGVAAGLSLYGIGAKVIENNSVKETKAQEAYKKFDSQIDNSPA